MTVLHETADLTCPRCGTSLAGLEATGALVGTERETELRIPVECPAERCAAPLAIVIGAALPDALGVEVWVEDRREEPLA